ncbi:hypothetical protein GT347_11605 [Xylophilus rhododendri]|uniref:Serine aminopeptidase S33 domain-containing protein n=1 Tax=Xylophilus rhododendri TaxID=2697032 RepID=A0A857J3S9_9BURK|nr:alpha/beta hydrolase [Xylophilus rhododendri]QHI98584.1 hypothetical protein GT347_11605 [Xylophilus rhododendri]
MSSHASVSLDARPVSFDREGRTLFGWYHPPAGPDGGSRDCLVVLCNPIGYDAICTHRHYRQLALRLAFAGFAVLRYDHHGTGDSDGTDEAPERIPAWTRGVSRAVEFGLHISGASKLSLFGVRMGATLALAAATQASAGRADSIVAWAPFSSGRLMLRETRAMRSLRAVDGSSESLAGQADAPDAGEEAGGYLLTHAAIAAMSELDLTSIVTPQNAAGRAVLLLERDDIPPNEKLARHLRAVGCDVTQSPVGGYAAMMRDTFDAVVPDEALGVIREWLEARYPMQGAGHPQALETDGAFTLKQDGVAVRDTPVRFGAHGNLFGILSRAVEPQGLRGRAAVLFVTTGSNHHIGPNRMYVTQGRALAAKGFLALRMDIGGVGESPAAPGQRDNHLFARHTVGEVHEAIAYLKTQGVSHVVMVGMCSGAYMAFRGAIAEPAVDSIVMINPQNFNWREGDSLEMRRRKGIRSLRFYRSRLLDRGTWSRVMRGQVDTKVIVYGVASLIRKRVAKRLGSVVRGGRPVSLAEMQDSTDVFALFRGLLQRGVKVFMVFSANDGGLDEVETHLGESAARLRRMDHFRFHVVEGADHTFTPLWAQKQLHELLVGHVEQTYG